MMTALVINNKKRILQVAVGRVIGRNGESIRSISRVSGAKIIVEREERALSPPCSGE